MGVQASPGEKHECRAAAVSGANSWSTVCLHAPGRHPPAAAQAAEAEAPQRHSEEGREEGSPVTPQKIAEFYNFS